MPDIIRSPQAQRDAIDIWTFIARDNPAAATRLLRLFDEKLELIVRMPLMGQSREDLAASLRSFAVGSYLLFYKPISAGIELVRVLHGARNLRSLFESD